MDTTPAPWIHQCGTGISLQPATVAPPASPSSIPAVQVSNNAITNCFNLLSSWVVTWHLHMSTRDSFVCVLVTLMFHSWPNFSGVPAPACLHRHPDWSGGPVQPLLPVWTSSGRLQHQMRLHSTQVYVCWVDVCPPPASTESESLNAISLLWLVGVFSLWRPSGLFNTSGFLLPFFAFAALFDNNLFWAQMGWDFQGTWKDTNRNKFHTFFSKHSKPLS